MAADTSTAVRLVIAVTDIIACSVFVGAAVEDLPVAFLASAAAEVFGAGMCVVDGAMLFFHDRFMAHAAHLFVCLPVMVFKVCWVVGDMVAQFFLAV